jgi:hypothetical protein
VVECLDAAGAEGMSAVNKDAGDALADVIAQAAELADVQTARTVVQVQYLLLGHLRGGRRSHHFNKLQLTNSNKLINELF